jgi:hypothetical protein
VTVGNRRYFLVERYVPEVDVRSVIATTQEQTGSTDDPRHIGTVVIAAEETCLSLFEATDARSVAAATEAAGVPADRIVEAEWFPGPSTPSAARKD